MEKQSRLAPLDDQREAPRFTQVETKTYECITNQNLPEWQRNFATWTWYTQAPLSVWNNHLQLAKTTALKLVHGDPVELEAETVAQIVKLTNVLYDLYNRGILPCSDRKAFAGILQIGIDVADWQNWYTAYQQTQQGGA